MKPFRLIFYGSLLSICACSELNESTSSSAAISLKEEARPAQLIKPKEGVSTQPDTTISSIDLIETYYSQPKSGDSLFKDKHLIVHGIVEDVKPMWNGKGVVMTLSGTEVVRYISVFNTIDSVALSFSKGDSVRVGGLCKGLLSGVEIHQGTILNSSQWPMNVSKDHYSAAEITKLFNQNEARAYQLFRGRQIEIEGQIQIKEDSGQWHYVGLTGHNNQELVGIHYEGQVPSSLKEGQSVGFKATFDQRSDMINFQKPIILTQE